MSGATMGAFTHTGEFRHRVVFFEPTQTTDSQGAPVTTFVPKIIAWAMVAPATSKQIAQSGIQGTSVSTSINAPWSPRLDRVTPLWKASFRGFVYDISGVDNLQQINREMVFACNSGANLG